MCGIRSIVACCCCALVYPLSATAAWLLWLTPKLFPGSQGWKIRSRGASRLVLTGVLYLVLDKKSDMEEDSLMEKFSDYGSFSAVLGSQEPVVLKTVSSFLLGMARLSRGKYREKTPSKLLPDLQSLLGESQSSGSTIDV